MRLTAHSEHSPPPKKSTVLGVSTLTEDIHVVGKVEKR